MLCVSTHHTDGGGVAVNGVELPSIRIVRVWSVGGDNVIYCTAWVVYCIGPTSDRHSPGHTTSWYLWLSGFLALNVTGLSYPTAAAEMPSMWGVELPSMGSCCRQ